MRVTIIGAGYVGLVTGIGLATAGHHVTFVERRDDRRQSLLSGAMPIEEPGLREAFAAVRERVDVMSTLEGAGPGDMTLVAVGTPIGEGGRSDLSQLDAAIDALRAYPDADVSVRSTLPPGISRRLPGLMGRPDGRRLSTNPEFLRQGEALKDVQEPSRIVIGRFPETEAAHLELLEALYADVHAPRLLVSVEAAELVKNVANAFLALKLSFVNEVASLAEEYGVEVDEILEGIGLDPRIGTTYMRPGLGFGGSCLPKELEVVANAGRRRGLPMHVARAISLVNADQQSRFAGRIVRDLGPGEHTVGLLGLSFKAGTDDLRGSPALAVARELLDAGLRVVGHDPVVSPGVAEAALPGLRTVATPEDVADGAAALVIGTEWPVYRDLDWRALRRRMTGSSLYDGRNLLDPATITKAGLSYRGVGRALRQGDDGSAA